MKALGLQEIDVSKVVDLDDRLRPISEPHARMISENIQRTGSLRMPIEVRRVKGGRYKVMAGGHRYWAVAKILEQPTIKAFVFDCSQEEALIVEIDENMVRRNLDALDESAFIVARKKAYEQLHPDAKNGAHGGRSGKRNENGTLPFSLETAEKIGRSRTTIERLVKIGNSLSTEAREQLRGTRFVDNRGELLALAKRSKGEQKRILDGLLAAEPKWSSVREAIDGIQGRKPKPVTGYDRLMSAWSKATAAERQEFRSYLAAIAANRPTRLAAE